MKNDNNIEKPIISIITDYLKAKETDFALMINGAWGCGKTYFIKNTLESKIGKIACPNKNNQKYKQIYVSLYGVSSIEEIKDKIFYGINPNLKWIDSISRRLFSAAEAIPQAEKIIKITKESLTFDKNEKSSIIEKITKYDDKVLVFDDLERIDFKSLDIQSVLGFINFLAEHNHCKIIVVANDGDLDEEYKQFKEKTIRFSYTYCPEKEEIFDNICEKYNDDYKQFLKEQKQFILEILNAGKCKNIRTLIFITDVFQKIFENTKGDFSNEINKDLLLPFAIISIEAKNGKAKEELREAIQSVYSLYHSTIPQNGSPIEEKNDSQKKYITLLWVKYNRFRKYNTFLFYDILLDLVYEGYVPQNRLENIIETKRKEYLKKVGREETKLVNQIIYWSLIPDDEFDDFIKRIKETISAGKFDANELFRIYEVFLEIEDAGIDNFSVSESDMELFKSAIRNAIKSPNDLPNFNIRPWFDDEESVAKIKYSNLEEYVKKICDERKYHSESIKKGQILEMIKNDDSEGFKKFINDISNRTILLSISAKDLILAVISANSETKQIFYHGLSEIFPENLTNPSKKDIDYLCEIKAELDNYLNKQTKRMPSLANLIFAQSYINNIIKKYQSGIIINTQS